MENLAEKAKEWLTTTIIIIVGLYVITEMVVEFCKTNKLFCTIVMGSILSLIVVSAKKILEQL